MGCVGPVSSGVSTSPGQSTTAHLGAGTMSTPGQGDPCLLPLWLGCSGAACSELCQLRLVAFLRVTDEPSGVTLKPSTAFRRSSQGWQSSCPPSAAVWAGHWGRGIAGHISRAVCAVLERTDPVTPCPPGDRLSGSKKNEGLSGAAVFY